MKYDVHIYVQVRVKVPGVEAESQVEAIKKADRMVDWDRLFDGMALPFGSAVSEVTYTEENTEYLVDEEGDEKYERSRYYDADMEDIRADTRKKEGGM